MLEVVPDYAALVAVSLDGVLTPMKDEEGPEKRAEAEAQGKQASGPSGYGSVKARSNFDKQRRIVLEYPRGVDKVIRCVAHLCTSHPRSKRLKQVLGFLKKNRHRMQYAECSELGLPIGSGVVESACKTLVTQRMKNSGMRWTQEGGQAILTMRSGCQRDRFDRAWALLAATYQVDVHVIAPVIEIRGRFDKV